MTIHKRFLLFAFEQYYPGGGLNDFIDSFDTITDAVTHAKGLDVSYYKYKQIYDRSLGVSVDVTLYGLTPSCLIS